jgi:hypothetical protein
MLLPGLLIPFMAWGQAVESPPPPSPTPDLTLKDSLKAESASETTVADQKDVSVTIYNNNLALVRDRRSVKLMPGEISLKFSDVAQQIKPETVSLRSLSAPGSLQILEQNYAYDLMSPQKMMEKYVGKSVRLVNFSTEIGFTEKEATLLSVNDGPIYQIGKEIYLGHPGQVVLPEIPANLIAKPSLIWVLQNSGTDHDIEVTYLTNGIQWQADYVLTLNTAENQMNVEGWVTLKNESGTQYANATMKVVAGELNIVQPQPVAEQFAGRAKGMVALEQAPMREETFAEYHLYTLPRRTTIKENESKQVSLLTASEVGVQKEYEYRGWERPFVPPSDQEDQGESVDVYLKFMNEEPNHLGMPLPAGTMRIYQQDSDGTYQFVGEDRIKHTPKDEKVRLKIGKAFDVLAKRTQTDFQQISTNVTESEFKIEVKNHKKQEIKIDIVEPAQGQWRVLSNSHEFRKKDAFTIVFPVTVPAEGETIVTYRIRNGV